MRRKLFERLESIKDTRPTFFIESELKDKYKNSFDLEQLSAERLNESLDSYDIFLSHSYSDKELILSVKSELETYGYKVYIDWIDDKQLNREEVTKETAQKLKDRMDKAKSLVFVTTNNSENSKWMPWELGYFDGKNGKVVILPVLKTSKDKFEGQEYLGLYPFLTKENDILTVVKDYIEYSGISNFKAFLENEIDFKKWINQ